MQGQPALVAERGPEIVIGRETTEAIMMNEPELLQRIVQYDRGGGQHGLQTLRAYDQGNVSTALADGTPASVQSSAVLGGENGTVLDPDTIAALSQLPQVMQQMIAQLQKPVHINMYGDDGLYKNMGRATRLMSKYEG